MIIGTTDAAAATSTVRSNASGKGSPHLMSKHSGRKWQASASASKSSDAAASSTLAELSHVGQEQETDADATTSNVGSNGNGFRHLMSQPCGLERRSCSSSRPMPFSHRHKSFQLHCPKVMDQGNGYDCGVHVCCYAYNLVQMVDLKVKNKDFTDNFASCISCHDLFDYNADDINRLRSQMHDLIVHVTSLYRNHRDTVIDCLNESDDEDDEDDVEIMYPVTQTSDDSVDDRSDKESNSESSFSQLDDDDDDLSADTTGDLDQIHYRTDKTYNYIDLDCNLAHDDGDADSSDLNVFVQLGDIIEYRSSKKDAPMKGQIVSIGALSSDRILQVSDGKWLSRKVHQVKRIEIVRPLDVLRLVNPSPMWKGLDKVVVIPPFETVDEVDEVDGVVENDINSGETTTTADTTSPGSAESIASDEPTAGTNQVEEEEEQIPFDVCVGAHVCLESANIDPNSGLYVSAIGVVVEIVYDKDHSVGPNGKGEVSLPKYIVVDFPTYKPPPGEDPWDKNNPTHLAISKMDHCTILQKKERSEEGSDYFTASASGD